MTSRLDTTKRIGQAREETTAAALAEDERAPDLVVWWASEVECVSALVRLERGGLLEPLALRAALQRLEALTDAWSEVDATTRIRQLAVRLLRVHPLRAADAMQLAAAIAAAEDRPSSLPLVTLDARLAAAAEREGFPVVWPMA